jgi:LmbE family N-acetylglucosaminyl deacetylase
MTIPLNTVLTILVVIAHPDDETLFGGFIHALTYKLNASVDLVCVTNGEGGNRHAGLSESFYGNLKLSEEAIGRKHLPRIRQQELFGSGRIVGIRKKFSTKKAISNQVHISIQSWMNNGTKNGSFNNFNTQLNMEMVLMAMI